MTFDIGNCCCVTREDVHLRFCSHIPNLTKFDEISEIHSNEISSNSERERVRETHTSRSISTGSNENIQSRMKTVRKTRRTISFTFAYDHFLSFDSRQRVNTRQMPMVMTNNLVRFQIPTFHHLQKRTKSIFAPNTSIQIVGTHLIFSTREQIWMSRRYCQPSDRRNVSRQRKFQFTRSQIPDLVSHVELNQL